MSYKIYFKGKRIIMIGLGVLGRGINVAKFLHECGAKLTITDLKDKKALAPALRALKKYKGITFVFGRHKLSDFKNCDMVVKAAGVPLDSPYIAEAKKHKIPVVMDASLFCELAPKGVNIIGVTGTRGKSTVTQLIYEILKKAGRRVFLGGNVRGMATLPLLKKVKGSDYVVLELDSWQLQGFGDANLPAGKAGISPHIAVFTNLMPDHLNYYKGSMAKYFYDKSHIYRYQKKEDSLIVHRSLARRTETKGKKIIFDKKDIPKNWKIKLLGEHNKENIAAAVSVARELGIGELVIRKVIEGFNGVPGRLELVRKWKGRSFYNDTTATMPDATIAALSVFPKKKIILIAGGNDKMLDFRILAREIPKRVKNLVLISGAATEKIKKLLPQEFEYTEVDSMKKAVRLAVEKSEEGDVVLLSPGATSFGIFKNEYDRGDQFVRLVRKLS